MQYYPFDSKNKLYKPHFGAVASDQKQKLRLLLHKDALCSAAFLLIKCDDEPDFKEVKLSPAEWLEDYQFFDCEIALDSGLYWYRFKYRSPYGEFYVTRCENSLGHVSDQGQCWQQTVYDNTFKTPDWLEGGVIYQIFPDRFFNSGSKKSNIPNNRFINNDWNKQPEYRQVAEKCTLGNDFYGGDIKGIIKKLPHIAELGVNCIYLNPIFEASSNHRYNTADYFKIDPLLGTEADLINLCKAAKKLGIAVILDGVFSHTIVCILINTKLTTVLALLIRKNRPIIIGLNLTIGHTITNLGGALKPCPKPLKTAPNSPILLRVKTAF